MDVSRLEKRWLAERRRAARRSRVTTWWIRLGIWFSGITLVVSTLQWALVLISGVLRQESQTAAPVADSQAIHPGIVYSVGALQFALCVINIWLLLLVLKRVKKSLRDRKYIHLSTGFTKLGAEAAAAVRAVLWPLATRLGVGDRHYTLVRPGASHGFSPSVVEVDDVHVTLVIPPDFLTLMSTKPNAARAMLAHEAGHVAQRDTNLWLFATAYADELFAIMLPANLGFFVVNVLAAVVFWMIGLSEGVGIFLTFALYSLLSLPALFFFYNRIRCYRRCSEELADLASVIATSDGAAGLIDCFRLLDERPAKDPTPEDRLCAFGFFGTNTSKRFLVSIHPKPTHRRRKIEHFRDVSEGKSRRVRLSPAASLISALYLLTPVLLVLAILLYPVFAQAGNAARKASAITTMKQISTALQMYTVDCDDVLPNPPDTATLANLLDPYLEKYQEKPKGDMGDAGVPAWVSRSAAMWQLENPNGGQVLMNRSIGGHTSYSVENVVETVLLYEDTERPDGTRIVAFLDGHVKAVKKDEWERARSTLTLDMPSQPTLPSILNR